MIPKRFPRATSCRHQACYLAMAALVCTLGGCAPSRDKLKHTGTAQNQQDDPFAAGANRPPTAKTLYAMARLFAQQGRDSECERVLRRIIAEHAGLMPAYCDLAELQMRQRRVDDAIQVLTAGLAVSPKDPVLSNNLGMCWVIKGDYERALAMFTEAASAMPYNARYRSNMALALGMMGRYEASLALFEQVVPSAQAHYNLAVVCEARNDATRALEEHRKAKRSRPTRKAQ